MTASPRNLLTTGGWDSTFRLLYLLLVEKKPVQPIYVIDPERWSLVQELKAMANIKKATLRKFPEAEELLLPTLLYDRTDIKPDPEIEASELAQNQKIHIGAQYQWLAKAVKQFGHEDTELCTEKHLSAAGCYPSIHKLVVKGEDGVYRMEPKYKGTSEYGIFGIFAMPVLEMFKPDMMEIARENDFIDILNMSWFCHRPKWFDQPCGTCNPCMDTMTKGMPNRLPPFGKACYYIKTSVDLRPFLKRYPRLFNVLKDVKKTVSNM